MQARESPVTPSEFHVNHGSTSKGPLTATPPIIHLPIGSHIFRQYLPRELWKEIIRDAARVESEFELCGFDGRCYTFEHPASYEDDWYRTFQTRLTFNLVSKSWNELSREYLYQSILVTPSLAGYGFSRLIERLTSNDLIKFVKRVTIHSSIANTPKSSTNDVLACFPNLEVVDIQTGDNFRPQVNQVCITVLHAHFDDWSAFGTLARLPHLRYLRCTVNNRCPIDSRINLNRLQTLDVQDFNPKYPFYDWLDVPCLVNLTVDDCYTTKHIALIHYFLSRIHHLGVNSFMIHPPRNPVPSHQLRSLTIGQAFGLNWRYLPEAIPLGKIEEMHISMEESVLRRSLPESHFRFDHCLTNLLSHTTDREKFPKLRCVYTDLAANTICTAKPEIRGQLRRWLAGMKERGIKALTYTKVAKYADHKYVPLETIFTAVPNWEYWEPTGIADERLKWDLLGDAAGRCLGGDRRVEVDNNFRVGFSSQS